MDVIVDTHIYKLHPNGGICRIFNETLPRICNLDEKVRFLMLSDGVDLEKIPPKHDRIIYSHYQQHLRSFAKRDWSNPIADKFFSKITNRLLRECGKKQIWHSTFYTQPHTWKGKRVVTVADMIGEKFQIFGKEFFPDTQRYWMRSCVENADAVICISNTTKQDLLEIYKTVDPKKVKVVHLSCGDGFYRMDEVNFSEELQSIDIPYFMFIGHRDYYKNFKILCEAFAKWSKRKDFMILAVGKPIQESEEKYWNELGIQDRVKVLNGLDDEKVCQLYNKATAFIYPSLYEGFGIPLLEAMHCGCPIIASDIPSTREIAEDCPIYFSPQNSEELIGAFEKVITEGRDSARLKKGSQRKSKFSWDRTAKETLEVYKSLA